MSLTRLRAPWIAIALAVLSPPLAPSLAAQVRLAVAPHVGSLGFGADLVLAVHRNVSLRGGGNVFPLDIGITTSDVDYDLSLRSPTFLVTVDLSPGAGFRLSGGLFAAANDFELTAQLAEPVDIGGTTYTPAEIGTLTGVFDTRNVAPYVGIGFGHPGRRRVGFFLDLGVAFQGSPSVTAEADGPIASQPQFQQDLQEEVDEIEDDVSPFTVYPVLAIGVAVGLGR